ncbi:MAG: hypothetical protein MZU79_01400 [Anaerotruncus sp.]|nr:hypothetical protein [Anaerotruncus sp.]
MKMFSVIENGISAFRRHAGGQPFVPSPLLRFWDAVLSRRSGGGLFLGHDETGGETQGDSRRDQEALSFFMDVSPPSARDYSPSLMLAMFMPIISIDKSMFINTIQLPLCK